MQYVLSPILHTASNLGLSIIASHRYTETHPDASSHDMRTVKHFVEYIAQGIEGIDATADEDRPKVDTIRVYWRCFTSEWRRQNKPIPEQVRSTITNVCSCLN